MRTTGISCGVCAAVSDMNLRRMPGIDTVTISLAKESISIKYKPGAAFSPAALREVLQRVEVGIVEFQIRVRGIVQEQGGKKVLIAATDRFVLLPAERAAAIPVGTSVALEGSLNDFANPMELEIRKQ